MSFWKRVGLRHSRALAAPLSVAAVLIVVLAVFAGRLPFFSVFVVAADAMLAMVAALVWAGRERYRLVRETPLPRFLRQKLIASYPHLTQRAETVVDSRQLQAPTRCN